MSKDWRDEVPKEFLPERMQEMAEIIGVANTIRLAEEFGGLPLYMPKADTMLVRFRNDAIRKEFTGDNQEALALKYGLCLRQIQEILKAKNGKGHAR